MGSGLHCCVWVGALSEYSERSGEYEKSEPTEPELEAKRRKRSYSGAVFYHTADRLFCNRKKKIISHCEDPIQIKFESLQQIATKTTGLPGQKGCCGD